MMAGLFAIFSLGIAFAFLGKRSVSIFFIGIGIVLTLLMFWHHATDILKINL